MQARSWAVCRASCPCKAQYHQPAPFLFVRKMWRRRADPSFRCPYPAIRCDGLSRTRRPARSRLSRTPSRRPSHGQPWARRASAAERPPYICLYRVIFLRGSPAPPHRIPQQIRNKAAPSLQDAPVLSVFCRHQKYGPEIPYTAPSQFVK